MITTITLQTQTNLLQTQRSVTVLNGLAGAGQVVEAARQQAVAASLSATEAATAEAAAEAARDAAVVAKDAAFVNANVYASTAAGLAATTDGQQFQVVSGSEIIRYTRTNSTTATEVARFYAKAFFDKFGMRVDYDRSGYVVAWLDSQSRMALGITDAGRVVTGAGGDIDGRIDGIPLSVEPAYARSGYVFAILDQDGRIGFGVQNDGTAFINGEAMNATQINARLAAVEAFQGAWEESASSLYCWGDSLTQGAFGPGATPWPSKLAALTGRPVANRGVGGQQSQPIACRFGAIPTLVTIAGNQIPASGSVAVTLDLPVTTQDFASEQGGSPMAGTLANIPGTLTRLGDGSFTFTRTTAGTAKTIAESTPFVTDASEWERQTNILWVGANDAPSTDALGDATIESIEAMIRAMPPLNKRFVLLSILTNSANIAGSAIHSQVLRVNAYLRNKYPAHFLDIRRLLVNSYNPAIPQDVTDYGNDVVPSSLRYDSIHLNDAGATIVANAVYQFLTEKGW